jgi:hypothetical protein
MKGRCQNPNDPAFDRYGGRGISVCAAWQDYATFRSWALASGYDRHLTIDRYPNKHGNYEPGNCRWATYKQQNRNRQYHRPITHNGETLLVSELAERVGRPSDVLKNRIHRYGWSIERALTTPIRVKAARS